MPERPNYGECKTHGVAPTTRTLRRAETVSHEGYQADILRNDGQHVDLETHAYRQGNLLEDGVLYEWMRLKLQHLLGPATENQVDK